MDPDVCLDELRAYVNQINWENSQEEVSSNATWWQALAVELAERVDAMDGWLVSEGHLPTKWSACGKQFVRVKP